MKETRMKSPYSATIGDIVLNKDDLPRGSWRISRIAELVKCGDGEIRSAKVSLPSDKMLGIPLNLLYPIECPITKDENGTNEHKGDSETAIKDNEQTRRPKRQCAIRALENIRYQTQDNYLIGGSVTELP